MHASPFSKTIPFSLFFFSFLILFIYFYFETRSPVAQACIELCMSLKIPQNLDNLVSLKGWIPGVGDACLLPNSCVYSTRGNGKLKLKSGKVIIP